MFGALVLRLNDAARAPVRWLVLAALVGLLATAMARDELDEGRQHDRHDRFGREGRFAQSRSRRSHGCFLSLACQQNPLSKGCM